MTSPALTDKVGLVVGIANKRSISWAIARASAAEGARLALTHQNARLEENVRDLAASLDDPLIVPCDVTNDAEIDAVFDAIDRRFGRLDFVVHGAAYGDLSKPFLETSREAFRTALEVSAYSLVALTRRAAPLLERSGGGSVLTLTYLGSTRVFPNYDLMGVAKAALESSVRYLASELGPKNIRVNAISAGPVRTLAARSIAGFPTMEAIVEERAPLHRHVEADDVGSAAEYLLGDVAKNVTGTTLYVDSGYHAMGM